jgi:P-type E1-E2 ATPase
MEKHKDPPRGMVLKLPGKSPIRLRHLVLDFNGTLALNGRMVSGIDGRLMKLSRDFKVSVLTGDTFGTADRCLAGFPLKTIKVRTGAEKRHYVLKRRREGVVAVGNGNNDAGMMGESTLGIAVLGREGAAPKLLQSADVVVCDIRDALDLLLNPRRLTATLRK